MEVQYACYLTFNHSVLGEDDICFSPGLLWASRCSAILGESILLALTIKVACQGRNALLPVDGETTLAWLLLVNGEWLWLYKIDRGREA